MVKPSGCGGQARRDIMPDRAVHSAMHGKRDEGLRVQILLSRSWQVPGAHPRSNSERDGNLIATGGVVRCPLLVSDDFDLARLPGRRSRGVT